MNQRTAFHPEEAREYFKDLICGLPSSPTGWRLSFEEVEVRLCELHCFHEDPGVGRHPLGVMGSVGEQPKGWKHRRLVDMASIVQRALNDDTATLTNPALQLVLDLRDKGVCYIRGRDEPYLLQEIDGSWYVRNGTKRSIALALLEEISVIGIDLGSFKITPPPPLFDTHLARVRSIW